jgi:cyclopropane fatty-acyl-phospholipid synthase-like methyltransferase
MSVTRQFKRRATRAKAKRNDVGPHVVRRIFIQAEVSMLAPDGRVTNVSVTDAKAVHEVEFPDWLWEWMAAGGLTPANRVAKQEKKTA